MTNTTTELRAIQVIEMGQIDPFEPVGSPTVLRLDARQWFRPAGNSSRFWKKIEADDPFKPAREKVNIHRPVYASGRFVRLKDTDLPAPKPARPPTPQAKRIARLEPEADHQGPSQVHTPDGKAVPSPLPKPVGSPVSEPIPRAVSPMEPIDRTPPTIIPAGTKKGTGRIRTSDQPRRRSGKLVQGGVPPTAAIASSNQAAPAAEEQNEPVPDISPDRGFGKSEAPPPPAARGLDSVLGVLGNLKAAQNQYEHEKDLKSQGLLPPSNPVPTQRATHEPPPQAESPQQSNAPENTIPVAKKRTFGTESEPAPEARNLDSVLGVLGALKAAQNQHEHEKMIKEQGLPSDPQHFADDDGWTPPPKPKAQAKPPPPIQRPPAQAAPPPKPTTSTRPPNRAPPTPGGGNLDDLFGGSNEGRVRIGRRAKPKPDGTE